MDMHNTIDTNGPKPFQWLTQWRYRVLFFAFLVAAVFSAERYHQTAMVTGTTASNEMALLISNATRIGTVLSLLLLGGWSLWATFYKHPTRQKAWSKKERLDTSVNILYGLALIAISAHLCKGWWLSW